MNIKNVALLILAGSFLAFAIPLQAQTVSAGATSAATSTASPALDVTAARPVITNQVPAGALDALAKSPQPAGDATAQQPGAATVRAVARQNEFQRFVEGATGQSVPRFGDALFGRAGSYSALERTPVPTDYVLGPGDELYIRGWGAVDIEYRAVIDRNGQISIPRVGTMGVAGIKAGEAEGYIKGQVSRVFKNFNLNVTLGQLRGIEIYVVGQARQPGTYTLSSLSTMITAVFASGGPSANGSMRQIQLLRANKVVATLDLYEFITQGRKPQDQRLLPGDTLVYPSAGPQVALIGAVDTPAIFELKAGGEPLSQVLGYGGGTNATTNVQLAQLERIDNRQPKAPRSVTTLSLGGTDASQPLKDGDIVTLFQVAPQFANAVTLRGNVAAPLRYSFTPGMRVSQLIPERAALITPDYYLRKNKLVQFTDGRDASVNTITRDVRNLVDEPNWEYAAIERLNADRLSTTLIPFNLGKAVIDRDPAHDLPLQPGDVVTIFGAKDILRPVSKQSRLVRLEGEVNAPGVYQALPGETLPALIQRAGGLTLDAYVFGTQFSRAETRRAQKEALDSALRRLEDQLAKESAQAAGNLSALDAATSAQVQVARAGARREQVARLRAVEPNGRVALELPEKASGLADLPALPLEDGDRITIPAKPAFVFAAGAVANTNALIWKPGKTVADYLDMAGADLEADLANMFVLRADGSIVHAARRGLFDRSLARVELMPGDTLVVPDATGRETFMTGLTRGLKDWSQIFYQFGLGAAAIKTLRN